MRCRWVQLLLAALCGHVGAQQLRHKRGIEEASTIASTILTEPSSAPARRRTQDSPPSVGDLTLAFQEARQVYITQLEEDYGSNSLATLFVDANSVMNATATNSIGRNAFYLGSTNSGLAWERSTRKMAIRILDYMIQGQLSDYVWATAGDSGAAGHGNFFNEQFTMVLQRRAEGLFRAVGLNFVTRPYAIAAATSAPEIAACAEEIYGTDPDIVTWDFAMTDGRWHWRFEFFAHRIMLMHRHPSLLVLRAGFDGERRKTVEHLTDEGMAVLRLEETYLEKQTDKFPDCRYKTLEELDAMPSHIKYFRCGRAIESGVPCEDHKFTKNSTCDDRDGRTRWHQGWKSHAYHGNLYTLFLMESIEDALNLIKQEGEDPEALLHRLQGAETADFDTFKESTNIRFNEKWKISEDVTAQQFYHDPVYCHTARLPAQTRYKGHIFNKERDDDWNSFKKGFPLKRNNIEPSEEMLLTYVPREMHNCSVTLNIDSQDFFLATPQFDGYQKVVIPNDAEGLAYGTHMTNGIIGICAATCTHVHCAGFKLLGADAIELGAAIMKVNGVAVHSTARFDECFLLVQQDGSFHWDPNAQGRFEIAIRVLEKRRYFRISSFLIW